MKKQLSVVNMAKTNLKLVKNNKLKRKKKFRLLHKKRELKKICKNRGVVFINHIPHGFYEEELFQYFSQFGVITAVKVPRSNKTGNSKGCAFVEFADNQVAQVAADAMNNYLMFDCLLKTDYIPPEKQRPIAFDRNGKPWVNRSPTLAADLRRKRDRKNKERPVKDIKKFAAKVSKCVAGLHKKLTSKTGIDYEFQINDDAQLLKITKKSEDDKPSSVDDEDSTDDEIKINDDAQLLKITKKSEDDKPSSVDDEDSTDDEIKVKKLKKTSKTDLAQAAVKKAVQKGTNRLLRSDTKEALKNTTKAVKSNAKIVKNNTKTALKNTTKKVLAVNKKQALKNVTKKVLASKKKEAVENTTKKVLKNPKNKLVKKSAKQVKKVTAV